MEKTTSMTKKPSTIQKPQKKKNWWQRRRMLTKLFIVFGIIIGTIFIVRLILPYQVVHVKTNLNSFKFINDTYTNESSMYFHKLGILTTKYQVSEMGVDLSDDFVLSTALSKSSIDVVDVNKPFGSILDLILRVPKGEHLFALLVIMTYQHNHTSLPTPMMILFPLYDPVSPANYSAGSYSNPLLLTGLLPLSITIENITFTGIQDIGNYTLLIGEWQSGWYSLGVNINPLDLFL